MGMVAILVMWSRPLIKFSSPHPLEAPYKIWLKSAEEFFLEKEIWKFWINDTKIKFYMSRDMTKPTKWVDSDQPGHLHEERSDP